MKEKKILTILYSLLVLAVFVVCFCIVMLVKTGKQEEGIQSEVVKEDSFTSDKQTLSGAFDGQLTGSGQLKEIQMEISGVPVIIYVADTKEEKPLLILQHGLTSKKEDMKDLAVNLAGLSYVVVTPDAAGHGELESKEELALAELAERTADNFDKLIAFFETSEYVDTKRTGIMGISLGGISAFYHAANGVYQPKVLVSLCATPDYEDLTKSHVVYEVYKNGKEEVVKDTTKQKELEELIISKSPYKKLLQNKETSFYLLCGQEDETVPHEGNVRFYEEMKDSAKDIVLSVKEKQKHEVTEEDFIKALEYLKGHL